MLSLLTDPSGPLRRLEVFIGECNPMACRLYARLPRRSTLLGDRLSGRVRGPRCRYNRTLEASLPLVDSGPGDSLLSACLIPDPCFWTPSLPFVYEVEVELAQRDKVLGSVTRFAGIRRLGIDGRQLMFEGRRWTPQGIRAAGPLPSELALWRPAAAGPVGLALVLDHPSDELCLEASLCGVPIIACLNDSEQPTAEELARLGRWPAVVIVLIEKGLVLTPLQRQAAPNTLVGQLRRTMDESPLPEWASLMAVVGSPLELERLARGSEVPVLAMAHSDIRPGLGPDEAIDTVTGFRANFATHSPVAGWIG
jgi:hypothetical protein